MSHSKPSATVNQKNSVLIICLHPGIRREFQDYLSALLGEYISFHILDPYQIHDPAQIRKFLYDSDRIENPDISRFFQSMDSALSCKLSSWRYHELAPSLFWKIFPDHIFSFHPWHLWFFSFISWTFVSKETMEITRS